MWATDLGTTFPTEVIPDLDVEDVKFRMENLHAEVGISPGDPRTTEDEVQLHWDESSSPGTIVFGDAPAGFYTNVVLKLDAGDGEDAFDIEGIVDVGGSDVDFRIRDSESLSISMNCALDLQPGADVILLIEVKLRDALAAIDYDALPEDSGRRVLEGGPQMDTFRSALMMQGFSVGVQPSAN